MHYNKQKKHFNINQNIGEDIMSDTHYSLSGFTKL